MCVPVCVHIHIQMLWNISHIAAIRDAEVYSRVLPSRTREEITVFTVVLYIIRYKLNIPDYTCCQNLMKRRKLNKLARGDFLQQS